MYSDKKSIQQLSVLLRAHEVKKVVMCPGNVNVPLIQTLLHISDFTCYSMNDERNAGFFALGLALHETHPVAVMCAEGSGLANLLPVVAEARRQQVQLVVISVGVGKGEAAAKVSLADGVKCTVCLTDDNSEESAQYRNLLINKALLECKHHGKGPVHISVQLSEPFFACNSTDLPEERVIERYQGLNMYEQDYQPLIDKLNRYKKRMVIAGQMNTIYEFDKKHERTLAKQMVWMTELLSNHTTPGMPIRRMEELLYPMDLKTQESLSPELLITFGGAIVSRRVKYFLRKHKPLEHWHVSKDGELNDVFGALTVVIEMDPFEFFEKIASLIEDVPPLYPRQWEQLAEKLPAPRFPYSEMMAVGRLMTLLPSGCSLHLGTGSVVRYAQMFALPEDVEIQSNMGLEGAEGVLATGLGYATASEKINYIVLGDVSFFSGMNALWNMNYGSNIRIMVVNNGGHEQLQNLPGFNGDERTMRFVTGSHQVSAQAWATDRGFTYLSAHNEAELEEVLPKFTKADITRQPIILEVFTDMASDAEVLKQYYKSLKK
ncbi:MAG: 2-succinyl-5-enolpyruvyl-6-hydroxy-3-cyclohexene-1-carboxylate synthase [Bacteroidaceae bacterium]|nr:2-succinyl-5-enolpyruvyl-6-hydroxy-3-cyclohexene-1-carboxylate synthase [Bacteroidaceae bacterium]